MSAPPPPPPPGPPPPAATMAKIADSNKGRGALLGDIHKGKKLKKTVTNDKSGPAIDKNAGGGGATTSPSGGGKGGGMMMGGMVLPPAGMFFFKKKNVFYFYVLFVGSLKKTGGPGAGAAPNSPAPMKMPGMGVPPAKKNQSSANLGGSSSAPLPQIPKQNSMTNGMGNNPLAGHVPNSPLVSRYLREYRQIVIE